jgi:hypothetical protein
MEKPLHESLHYTSSHETPVEVWIGGCISWGDALQMRVVEVSAIPLDTPGIRAAEHAHTAIGPRLLSTPIVSAPAVLDYDNVSSASEILNELLR